MMMMLKIVKIMMMMILMIVKIMMMVVTMHHAIASAVLICCKKRFVFNYCWRMRHRITVVVSRVESMIGVTVIATTTLKARCMLW